MNLFETVKSAVTVKQAAEYYGCKVNRGNMICCPFHDDRHPSMKLNRDYFYCFGCGATGDVIDFVTRLFGLSSYEAAKKLAYDFGIDPDKPPAAMALKKPYPLARAFRYCSNLSQVNIPNSITEIGDQTFRFCESLTSVTIPPSVTKIGAWAFAGCTSLKETNIGENVITIGEHAFSDCSSLAQVVVPDSNVTSIGDYAFSNCSSLTKMDIPDSVTTLGAGVFASCTSLKEIIVGNSVNSIGSEAFAYCDSTIYFKSDTPPEVGDNIFLDCPADMLICYPAGSEDNWGPEWQGFATQAWDPTSNPTPEEPSLSFGAVSKNPETGEISFTLTFTGTLQESTDGITWSDVSDAAEDTYTVTVQKNQNRFFRAVVK